MHEKLKIAQKILTTAKHSEQAYFKSLDPLIAAHCTMHGDPRRLFHGTVCDEHLAKSDRDAIKILYDNKPVQINTRFGRWAIEPLIEWLDAELAPSATPLPTRITRLQRLKEYLLAEQDRLAVATANATNRADVLKIINDRLEDGAKNTSEYRKEKIDDVMKLGNDVAQLNKLVAEESAKVSEHKEKEQENKRAAAESETSRILTVLDWVRPDVLIKANEAQTSGLAQVHQILKKKLIDLEQMPETGKLGKEDISLTKLTVGKMVFQESLICDTATGLSCKDENQMDVIDTMIASLRAQRIQALAQKDDSKADYLMRAINAAYDQRTALLHLRPASDYLRSVYSASTLQNGAEPIYRNMLDEWFSYANVKIFGTDKNDLESNERKEVEKLYWQNINRVTVNGGGLTNYVLAKDDVGNWYVKAYGSDPEAILKSATSLALFNAGAGINTNLLRRHDLQRMADDPKTNPTDRRRHESELDKLNAKDGIPLLRVRDRYEKRYVDDTRQHALSVHEMLKGLPEKVEAIVDKAVEPDSCKIEEMRKSLTSLEKIHLETARNNIGSLLNPATEPDQKKNVEAFEKAVQQGLTAAFLYGGQVHKKLIESQTIECNEHWRRGVAAQARAVPHAQLLTISVERRQSIERYEEALTSIADVATESR